MTIYASNTSVPVAKSRAEIESLVTRYGASRFYSGIETGRAVIGFEVSNKRVQFELALPAKEEFRKTERWKRDRNPEDIERHWEQACRQRWRALALVVKAKLEAVESSIATFEEEFLAYIVVPGGKGTVGQWLLPQLEKAYETGKLPPLLPSGVKQ